ncbi:MAG: F0F1 ATP synthase subunit delta [Byssovorax sp.]
MSHETIARRWARAVYDLGRESKNLTGLSRDLTSFAELYAQNDELSTVLDNPLVLDEAREAIVQQVSQKMGLGATAESTLRLLARKRRLAIIADLSRQVARLADLDDNVLRAEVTSAAPLGEAYLGRLKAELEKSTGKKIVLTQKQDASLIGGVVTRIGDKVIDGSVKARLAGFRESLLRT